MKRILALILVALMALTFVACNNETPDNNNDNNDNVTEAPAGDATEAPEGDETPVADPDTIVPDVDKETLGYYFFDKFLEIKKADPTKNAETVVNEIMSSKLGTAVQFPMVMPVEPGFLTGFSADINGFESATLFAPGMMGVAFVGYVFDLAEGTDVAAFIKTLADNADPRWNMCTEAEMTAIGAYKNSVIIVMCPKAVPSSVSGIAAIIEPTLTAGSASETLWNEFKTVMSGENAFQMIAAEVVDALAANAFKGEVTYVEEWSFENKDVFTYTIEGFNNASYITSGDKIVYVLQLDEGMDVANWMSYYFDGIKAASSAYGAYNNTIIVMVNVG